MFSILARATGFLVIKTAKPFILKALIPYIFSDKVLDWLVDMINNTFDLSDKLTEKEERIIIHRVVRGVQQGILDLIEKY